ncbi:MAG: NUDIX domain-containing protein [Butyricimonas faecihominis]
MDETTNECAVRELEEETGLKDVFVEQLQAFSDVDRDPRDGQLRWLIMLW